MAYREAHEQPERKLTCPACQALLVRAPVDEILYGCTGCGGCWADSATATRVTNALDERLLELAKRAEDAFADLPLPQDHGRRACPECQGELDAKNVGHTALDVCEAHGTWFDRGELERVARVLDAERATAESFTPAKGETIALVGDKLGAALITFSLLMWLLAHR